MEEIQAGDRVKAREGCADVSGWVDQKRRTWVVVDVLWPDDLSPERDGEAIVRVQDRSGGAWVSTSYQWQDLEPA